MKRVEKHFIKIDFKNARFEMVDGELFVVEFDKEGCIVEETPFLDAIQDLMGENNVTISIKKENDVVDE